MNLNYYTNSSALANEFKFIKKRCPLFLTVKANFIERAEDYVWSSARAHFPGIKDDILSVGGWLEGRELNAYRKFLKDEGREIEPSIRKATSTGRPLGSERLVKILERILERDILPKKAERPKKKG